MKNIGFLFGQEKFFSQNIINKINESKNKIKAEPITIDIINNYSKKNSNFNYDVIFDRCSNNVPFYRSAMNSLSANGIKIINSSFNHFVEEEIVSLTLLKAHKINVPKIAVIPSKNLPYGVLDEDMHNLKYPLDWDEMFNKIGFPANIKSNNSNDLFDTYRVYSKQDFFFIYDMSGTKTLLFQECIEAKQNIRIFVVGKNKTFLNYELHKAPKDRYSIFEDEISDKVLKGIRDIIKSIQSLFGLEMFIVDVAIDEEDKLFLLSCNLFNMNIDTAHFLTETYNWLVDSTAEMLLDCVADNEVKKVKKVK